MSRRFTEIQIREQVAELQSGELHRSDSLVYQAWANLADAWLADSTGDYQWEGFDGFKDRSVDEIIEDFQNYDLIRQEGEPAEPAESPKRNINEFYVHNLNNGGTLELDVEDASIRYFDSDGNCENIIRVDDESERTVYDDWRRLFDDLPTLVDLRNALQEAQDNFNTETGSKVEDIINTLPEGVDLVPLEEEFEWVFKQVGRTA